MKKLYILLSLILLSSCSHSAKHSEVNKSHNLINVDKEEDCIDTTYFKSVKLFFPQTKEFSEIRNIDRIIWDDNKYFILDTSLKSVFIFNESGKHLETIHTVGGGPGEYYKLYDIGIDNKNKQLFLFGESPYKIMSYDYNGKMINEIKINLSTDIKEICLDGNDIIFLNHLSNNNDCYLNTMNINNNKTNSLLYSTPINFDVYSKGTIINKNKNIHFSKRFENSIYEVDNLEITEKYTIDFNSNNIPFDLLNDNMPDSFKETYKDNKYVYTIFNIHENDNYLAFRTNLPGFYIYEKAGNVLKEHSFILNSKYNFYASRMMNIDNSENSIAFVIDPQHLLMVKELNEQLSIELEELITNIKIDDNPILMICEFKD